MARRKVLGEKDPPISKLAVSFDDQTRLTENTKQTHMKTTKCFLLTLLLLTTIFGQAQTIITNMVVQPTAFCDMTTIKFDLANNDTVSLEVYDRWGQAIRVYFTNTPLPSGSYTINFFSDSLTPGTYVVRFAFGDTQQIVQSVIKLTCTTTSINATTLDNKKLILYPNPTSDLLTIPIDGEKNIIATNLQGQICKTVKTYDKTISLADLQTGDYLVSIFNQDNKLLTTCKIVKVK